MTAARSIATLMVAQDRRTVPAPLYLSVSPSLAAAALAYHAAQPDAALARRVYLDDAAEWSWDLDAPEVTDEAVVHCAEMMLDNGCERACEWPMTFVAVDSVGRESRWSVAMERDASGCVTFTERRVSR